MQNIIYGITKTYHLWFSPDRKQGVLLGFILCSIQFLIYINDLPKLIKPNHDTIILNKIRLLKGNANNTIIIFIKWFTGNWLTLNCEKTLFALSCSKNI